MAPTEAPAPRRAVIRAEDFYLPPPGTPPTTWALVPPAERAILWWELKNQLGVRRPQGIVLGARRYARIDHGRWVADCPECPSAQIVTPADPRLFCVECRSGWFALAFPADVAAAEAAVDQLPVREQNWWHDEDDTAWNQPQQQRQPTGNELGRLLQPDGDDFWRGP